MKIPFLSCAVVACMLQLFVSAASGTPSDDPDVVARRGKEMSGQGTEMPVLTLAKPEGGVKRMRKADPLPGAESAGG